MSWARRKGAKFECCVVPSSFCPTHFSKWKRKKGIIDTAVHWFACCVSIDGLDISSNGGRVGDGTERTERRCVLRCWWVAPIFFGGVGLPSPYLVWLLLPGLPSSLFLPYLNPLPGLPTIMHLLFCNFWIQDREPQSLPVCLMCVCSSLCSSGAVFCNACVAHMMKNWNKTGLNTMKSRTLQSNPHTSGFQLPRLQAAPWQGLAHPLEIQMCTCTLSLSLFLAGSPRRVVQQWCCCSPRVIQRVEQLCSYTTFYTAVVQLLTAVVLLVRPCMGREWRGWVSQSRVGRRHNPWFSDGTGQYFSDGVSRIVFLR